MWTDFEVFTTTESSGVSTPPLLLFATSSFFFKVAEIDTWALKEHLTGEQNTRTHLQLSFAYDELADFTGFFALNNIDKLPGREVYPLSDGIARDARNHPTAVLNVHGDIRRGTLAHIMRVRNPPLPREPGVTWIKIRLAWPANNWTVDTAIHVPFSGQEEYAKTRSADEFKQRAKQITQTLSYFQFPGTSIHYNRTR